ncbi:hypothetical protein B0O99DRAFT_587602 [Bisporella sp. PMI_857]|nr:hypothetical protein B0O99DRAFT_587602 [Bisporella sp. PMI_857]
MNEVELQMPIQVGDYTDFWCSEHHALNGSKINRNMSVLPEPWYRLPGGYMGRASSIGIDQDVHRPLGQSQLQSGDPHVGPCQKFDFEVEFAWVIGKENKRGARIPLERAEDHLFGAVLMNDWSARDFAVYEVQTGGVTTCKNFATTISPWIVSIEALAPFKATLPLQQPEPVPHLSGPGSRSTYDVHIQAYVGKPSSNPAIATIAAVQTTETNLKHIYWTPAQMIAYFTISGANFRSGDIFGTGTVSGPDEKSLGCLLEKSWGGTREWEGPSGEKRTWLEDGDKVVISAYCEAGNLHIGFGRSTGTVLPALT